MIEKSETLWDLINKENAHIYVCGDGSKMADDVDKTWKEIVKLHGGLEDENASKYMNDLAKVKRYQRDVWVS